MARDSDRHWLKQAKIETLRLVKAQRKSAREADDLFEQAGDDMRRLLDSWYRRYASSEGITLDEAQKALEDRRAYELTIEEYQRYAQWYDDPVAARLLERYHVGSQISRLQYLQLQLNELETALYGRMEGLTRRECISNYEDAYYRNIYAQHQEQGLATPFARINPEAVTQALETPIRAHTISERIWGDHRVELAQNLNRIIGSGMALGTTKEDMTRQLMAQMEMSEGRARTLIRTEVARMRGQATIAAMRANGTPQYKFVAILDALTSVICRQYDGYIGDVDNAKIGVNYPPMHPNCRSVGTPYWPPEDGDDDDFNTRFARAGDGTGYKVPADMTYGQWYDKYVNGNPKELMRYTMQRNASRDMAQLEQYKQAGIAVQDTLAEFQRIKYCIPQKWAEYKQQYRLIEQWRKGELSPAINKEKQARHMLGKDHIAGRSYISISLDELQKIVNEVAGTGKTAFRGPGLHETVDTGQIVGVILNDKKPPQDTTWVKIHYSDTGTHIVPTIGGEQDD